MSVKLYRICSTENLLQIESTFDLISGSYFRLTCLMRRSAFVALIPKQQATFLRSWLINNQTSLTKFCQKRSVRTSSHTLQKKNQLCKSPPNTTLLDQHGHIPVRQGTRHYNICQLHCTGRSRQHTNDRGQLQFASTAAVGRPAPKASVTCDRGPFGCGEQKESNIPNGN